MRYRLKEKLLRIKDDFTVRNQNDELIFNIKGSFLRIGDEFRIEDTHTGQEVLRITEKVLGEHKKYHFYHEQSEIATIRKKEEVDYRNNFFEINNANGMTYQLRGNFQQWDFEILDYYGNLLGHIQREWAFGRDSYTVDVPDGVDAAFLIGVAVVLDEMKEDRIKTE